MIDLRNGFSLVEMLIAILVSAIIIAASFGSYTVIANNFTFQKDMKYIAQSARAVVNMINKDIRMAGYATIDNSVITDGVILSDSGVTICCDAISLVYDQSPSERRQVTYWAENRSQGFCSNATGTGEPDRYRLCKQVCSITDAFTISEIQNGDCNTVIQPINPIADYVEDLQFSGYNSNCSEPGGIAFGCGIMQNITPSSISSSCRDPVTNVVGSDVDGALTSSGFASYAFDGNHLTSYACKRTNPQAITPFGVYASGGKISLTFSNPVRLTKITARTVPEIDGGTGPGLTQAEIANFANFVEPYGKYRPLWTELALGYGRSGQQCINTCNDGAVSGNSCTNSHWTGGQQCILQSSARYEGLNIWGTTSKDMRNETRGGIDKQVITELDIFVNGSQVCKYVAGSCVDSGYSDPNGYLEIAEIQLFGEVFGTTPIIEIETSILLRSPNKHGNVDRSVGSPLTLGNRTLTWNDRFLRDSFTTSTLIRNLFYASQ